ncbi:MAG: tripartite tricarboxylate transporter substrate binding protein [Bradyrhizobium sp.]|nr:tripartite tricarboxylate transporter substrate binding protein [Bradyrhizobium sp.]
MPTKLKAFVAALTFGYTALAGAQAYPTKPVRVVVTSSPGASSDLLARVISDQLSKTMGNPFVVENRPGAGGNVAGSYVAHQPADGYTILLASVSSHGINPSLYKNMPYDPLKDFEPIIALASNPNALVVTPSSGIKSVAELIAYMKANPLKASFSSGGSGTSQHLAAELFGSMAGVKMLHVPFKGSPEAVTSVIRGESLLMFANIPNVLALSKSGSLKMLGVTSAKRLPWLPEMPTIQESGMPGYEATAWFGFVAPAGTPAAVIEKINAGSKKALAAPEVDQVLIAQGFEVMGGSPQDFRNFMAAEIKKWAKVVAVSGATVN